MVYHWFIPCIFRIKLVTGSGSMQCSQQSSLPVEFKFRALQTSSAHRFICPCRRSFASGSLSFPGRPQERLRLRLARGADRPSPRPQVPPGEACSSRHQGLVKQEEDERCRSVKAPLVRWRPRRSASPRLLVVGRQQRLRLLAVNLKQIRNHW